tara:strand:- start:5110 stop:6405 length:1296 start_codon:yes stop_codon:yes gene_type:complete
MPTDLPIPPEQLVHFRRISKRLLAATGAAYLLCLALIPLPLPRWSTYALMGGMLAAVVLISLLPRGWWRETGWTRDHRVVLPYPLSYRYIIALGSAGLMMYAPTFALGSSPAINVYLALPFLALGGFLVLLPIKSRELVEPGCPKCRYDATALNFPARCPECGHPMSSIADASVVAHVPRPNLIWIGIVLLLVGAGIVKFVPLQRQHIVTLLPQRWRIDAAPRDQDAFATLKTTTLSASQHARLVDGILDQRARTQYFRINSQLSWVAGELVNGRLSAQQTERFINEDTRPELTIQVQARVGQSLPMSFLIQAPHTGIGDVMRWYFVRSLTLGDETLVRRETTPRLPARMIPPARSLFATREVLFQDPQPFHTAVPTTPGPTTARVDAILITMPGYTTPTITWHDDNTYTITPEPLTTHEVTAETTIEVTP